MRPAPVDRGDLSRRVAELLAVEDLEVHPIRAIRITDWRTLPIGRPASEKALGVRAGVEGWVLRHR